MANAVSLITLLASAAYLYLGGYAYRLNPRSTAHRLFLMLCLTLGWWAFFYAFVYSAPNKETAWVWFKLAAPGWSLIGGVGLHLALVLSERLDSRRKKWWIFLLYLPGTAVWLRAWTGRVTAEDFLPTPLGWGEVFDPRSFWLWFHIVYYSLAAFLGLSLLFAWGRASKYPLQKRQSRVLILSVSVFYVLGTVTNIALPLLNRPLVPSLAPIFGIFWAYGVWQAIVRYRFLNLIPTLVAEEIILRMSDLLILTDQEGLIERINPQAEKALGYREEELLHQPISKLCRANELVKEVSLRMQRGRLPVPAKEVELKTSTGEWIPVQMTLSPLARQGENLLGLMIIAEDLRATKRLQEEIETRKTAEEALKKAQTDLEERIRKRTEELSEANEALKRQIAERAEMEQLFRTLFVQSPIGTYLAQDGRMIMANPEFEKITGYREKELASIPPLNLVYPEDREAVRDNAIRMLRGERHQPYEYRFVTKSGRILWILETVTSIQYQGKRATLGNFMDITERKESEETIHRMAFEDPLTGLPNRALFHDRFTQALALAKRHNQDLTLMMIDLDNFKEVNDHFGHQYGDLLLREIGNRLECHLRKSDTVARMGGDEFMVLLPDTGPRGDGIRVAEKILELIRRPVLLETETVRVTASIGLAFFPADGTDEQTLIKNADRAMYRAKEKGRNRIEVGEGR